MNDADIESIAQMASLANNQIPQDDYEPHQQQDSKSGTKRKAEDGSQPQQRAKRNRYISIACNEVSTAIDSLLDGVITDTTCSVNDGK